MKIVMALVCYVQEELGAFLCVHALETQTADGDDAVHGAIVVFVLVARPLDHMRACAKMTQHSHMNNMNTQRERLRIPYAPSVTVSQWHDTDACTPAPFFCMIRQLTTCSSTCELATRVLAW